MAAAKSTQCCNINNADSFHISPAKPLGLAVCFQAKRYSEFCFHEKWSIKRFVAVSVLSARLHSAIKFKSHPLCSVPQTAMSEISCSCAFLGMTTKANTLVWNWFWNLMLVVQFFQATGISSFPFSSIPPTPRPIPAHNDFPQTFGPRKVLTASKGKSLASASAFQSFVKVSRLSDWVCLVVSKLVARHQEALTSWQVPPKCSAV